jgi:hypothetical protein
MKKLLTIILVSAFFTACGGASGGGGSSIIPSLTSDKFTVKLKGADVPFEMKKAAATIRPDLKELQLLFANYDIELAGTTIMGAPRTSAPGQKYIKFFIKNQKATSAEYKTPIKPGEYTEDIVTSYYDHDEPSLYETFFAKQGGTRKVTITSITEEKVTGTVDITVGDNSIKGKFEAQFLPK